MSEPWIECPYCGEGHYQDLACEALRRVAGEHDERLLNNGALTARLGEAIRLLTPPQHAAFLKATRDIRPDDSRSAPLRSVPRA